MGDINSAVCSIDLVVNEAVDRMNERFAIQQGRIRLDDCIIRISLGRHFGHTTWLETRLAVDADNIVLVSSRKRMWKNSSVFVFDPSIMNPASQFMGRQISPKMFIIQAEEIRLPEVENNYLRQLEILMASCRVRPTPIVILG